MSKVLSFACFGLVCLAGIAQAGDNGTLVDDFAVLDGSKYDVTLPSQDAAVEIGIFAGKHTELQLRNGGMLVTKEGFKPGTPINVQFAYEAEFNRTENLFVLQSDGTMGPAGLQHAVGAKIGFQAGAIDLVQITNGDVKVLATYKLPNREDGAKGFPRGAGVNWYNLQLVNGNGVVRVSVSPIADPASAVGTEAKYAAGKKSKGGERVLFMNQLGAAGQNGSNSVFLRHLRIGNSALAKK